jgi:deoxyribonuclease V
MNFMHPNLPTPFTLPSAPKFSALPDLPNLDLAVGELLSQLPRGRVTTYGQLSKALGVTTAAKWIATYLLSSSAPLDVPSHRVVRVDGSLGDYQARTAAAQMHALTAEGVEISKGRVDLDLYGFDEFQTDWPLRRLMEWQNELAQQIQLVVPTTIVNGIKMIGGVDVSYVSPNLAIAGYALTDIATGELVWSHTRVQPLSFPYISGFLGFRELPALLPLLEEVHRAGQLADVLIVDGNGTLHARSAGVASHLGVVTGIPTIGVSKTLSFGKVDCEGMQPGETRPIHFEGRVIGTALRPKQGSKPVFVSPGHLMDLATATQLAVRACHTHRLPEPQYWADRLSREATRRVTEPRK